MVAVLHSFAPHHDEEEEEKILTLDRLLTIVNPRQKRYPLKTQNGQPLYKWPFAPFIDQGGERLTMWDHFPHLPSYLHSLHICAVVAQRQFARLPRVSARGRKSSRQCALHRSHLQAHPDLPDVAKERSVPTLPKIQKRSRKDDW